MSAAGKRTSDKVWNGLIIVTAIALLLAVGMILWRLPQRFTATKEQNLPTASDMQGLSFVYTAADTEFAGVIDLTPDGRYSLTMQKPQSIAGLQLTFDRETEKIAAEYYGMTLDLSDQPIFSDSILPQIIASLTNVTEGGFDNMADNGILTEIIGAAKGISYRLILDENGKIKELGIPDLDAQVYFDPAA